MELLIARFESVPRPLEYPLEAAMSPPLDTAYGGCCGGFGSFQ